MLSTSSQLPFVVFMSTLHNLHLDKWTQNLHTSLQKTRRKCVIGVPQQRPRLHSLLHHPVNTSDVQWFCAEKRHILYDITLFKLYNSSSTVFIKHLLFVDSSLSLRWLKMQQRAVLALEGGFSEMWRRVMSCLVSADSAGLFSLLLGN